MKQITEDYCNKDISVMLKEKGFDVPVKNHFSLNKDAMLHNLDKKYGAKKNWNAFEICISRPSQSLALKWLREVHRIETHIVLSELNTDNSRKYMFDIYSSDINRDFDSATKEGFNSYEQAVEAALKYTLENLI